MHKLLDYVCSELDVLERKVGNGSKLTMAETQYMDTLAHAKKNLLTGDAMMDGGESGYYMPNRMYGNSYGDSYRNSYRDGDSYRRDSMGRYASRRSYDSGLADELHEIMDKAPDESVKRDIKRAIDKIERM